MKFQRNVLLKNYTTFKIGGPARYFCTAKNKQDLMAAVKWAKEKKLPFFVLGGGSNLLVSDQGFDGLVIKIKNEKLKIKNCNLKFKIFFAGAGLLLAKLVAKTADLGVAGLEWAAGIPGTVGGAVRGNAGAFEGEMKDVVKEVEAFDVKTGKVKKFKNEDCRFNYRNSIFKKNSNLIILSCKLQLQPGDKKKIKEKIQGYLDYRGVHHPKQPSAGSIFKNPKNTPAAKLIAECGLKGKKIGGAQISEKHPNFIINLRDAKSEDVLKLINLAKKEVRNKFGKNLKEEIQYLGF